SLPPGCPADYYARLLRVAQGKTCRCVLDADGAPLREGLKARPWMLKPNRAELEALTGRRLESIQQVRAAARGLNAGAASGGALSPAALPPGRGWRKRSAWAWPALRPCA